MEDKIVYCVCCGRPAGPGQLAFIEYSPGNIKLRRCGEGDGGPATQGGIASMFEAGSGGNKVKSNSRKDDKLLNSGCGEILDKYCEYEPFLIAWDILLHETGAYRHFLLNVDSKKFRVLPCFTAIMILEFYIRMYYFDDVLDLQVIVPVLMWSLISWTLSLILTYYFAKIGSKMGMWKSPSLVKISKALVLGNAVKMLFLLVSIWTYPKLFLLVLRLLAFSCTSVALSVVISDEKMWQMAIIAGAASITQCIGHGGGFRYFSTMP